MHYDLVLDEGAFLVKLARRAISCYLESKHILQIPDDVNPKLLEKCGVFVTLSLIKNGSKELRGCIGYTSPELSLVETIIKSAVSSATQDPRFPTLTKKELPSIIVEISILTPPTQIFVEDARDYPRQIRIGKDGLIVEYGWHRGLLLPQVPVEWHWENEEFLCNCCLKAGLPPDIWLLPSCKIYKFQAIVFQETSPGGDVERVEFV